MTASIPNEATHAEWRACGSKSGLLDTWSGPWRRDRPASSEIARLRRRSNEVWLERREVATGRVERVDV